MAVLSLEAPAPLSERHRIEGFSCGVPALDEWLLRRAWNNQRTGASRTYVVAAAGQVAGYYCLASGALALGEAPGRIRRNMPDPVPMAILGRLAVDRSWQGKGIGVALLRDAFERTQAASAILGIRGLLVHALSPAAAAFLRASWIRPVADQSLDPGAVFEAEVARQVAASGNRGSQ